MDLRFYKRELELENIKTQLYNIVDLKQLKFDENKIYFSLVAAFRSISHNGHVHNKTDPGYVNDLDVFVTLDSIKTNYKQIFKAGGYNSSMSLRLYNLLSCGKLMKNIYLPQFLLVMHPLIYGNWIEKNYFAFRFYDGDNDGVITSVDVQDCVKNVIEQCPMSGVGKNATKQCKCVLY